MLFYTPYWTTFELLASDMKSALVGILDQIAAGVGQRSLRKSRTSHVQSLHQGE
jgi:hypothetical protein